MVICVKLIGHILVRVIGINKRGYRLIPSLLLSFKYCSFQHTLLLDNCAIQGDFTRLAIIFQKKY